MRLRKNLFLLLTVAVLLCTIKNNVFAQNVPDESRKGSIQITMSQENTAIPGGTLTIYQVGAVSETNGNVSFVPAGKFSDCGFALTNVQSAQLAKKLSEYADDKGFAGTTKEIDSKGKVSFTKLKIGLYLLVQNKAAKGYKKTAPFLVSIPMLENRQYVYNVDASPKLEQGKETVESPEPADSTKAENGKTPVSRILPQTGQLNWPIPLLAAVGMCLFSAGWILRFGKRGGSYEK